MKSEKLLKEELGAYPPRAYPATSVPPRKDFVPFNKKDGYNYNRQINNDSILASAPTPPFPPHLPWELDHIIDDLSDATVYLEVAIKKISNCAKNSKAINNQQKKAMMVFFKAIKKASQVVKKVGMKIEKVANIADQPKSDNFVPTGGKAIKRN